MRKKTKITELFRENKKRVDDICLGRFVDYNDHIWSFQEKSIKKITDFGINFNYIVCKDLTGFSFIDQTDVFCIGEFKLLEYCLNNGIEILEVCCSGD